MLGLHVIEGAFKAADLSDGQTLTTLGGATLTVSLGDGTVSFTAGDGANVGTVLTADLMSCSGVLHIIDVVLTPGPVSPPPVEEPPAVDPPVEDTPVEDPPAVDPPVVDLPPGADLSPRGSPGIDFGCDSLFDIVTSTGELGNFETVVDVRRRPPGRLFCPCHVSRSRTLRAHGSRGLSGPNDTV